MSFATAQDFAECEALHKKFGTTYYYASRLFPPAVREQVHAVYGFVRVPDEWVDNPEGRSLEQQKILLQGWRESMLAGLEGVRPEHGVMRAFVDTMIESKMDVGEPLLFMDAMEMDLTVERYATYEDLRGYMRGSASAVGVMMLYVLEQNADREKLEAARILGEAMQMTNFLRDVAEDTLRGRIYLPLEDMERFGVSEEQVLKGRFDENFRRLMEYEVAFTRHLYSLSDEGIGMLGPKAQKAVLLARVLYAGILDEIEKVGGNVFLGRVRTSSGRKAKEATKVLVSPGKVLADLSQYDKPEGLRMESEQESEV